MNKYCKIEGNSHYCCKCGHCMYEVCDCCSNLPIPFEEDHQMSENGKVLVAINELIQTNARIEHLLVQIKNNLKSYTNENSRRHVED